MAAPAVGLLDLAHSDAFLHKVLSHLRLQDLLVRPELAHNLRTLSG